MTRSSHRRATRGFTLMEMLVVLGILVMLMALVVPRLIGAGKKADVSGAKVQVKSLMQSLKQYMLDMKSFPTTEQGLKALIEKPADMDEDQADRWDGPYIEGEELPKDPWHHDYQYEYPPKKGTGKLPDLWSFGPDGEDGTDDDVVSWSKENSDEAAPGESSSTTDKAE